MVAQAEPADLDRVPVPFSVQRNKHSEYLSNGLAIVLKDAVTVTVTSAIGIGVANRQGGGRPIFTALFVADVDCLRLGIADRIVLPGRQSPGLAISGPRPAETALTDRGAKAAVGDHIDPGRWRVFPGLQIDRVLPRVVRKTADSVEVRQFEKRQRWRLAVGGNAATRGQLRRNGEIGGSEELLLQRSAVSTENRARRRKHERAMLFRYGVPVPKENSARSIEASLASMSLDLTLELQ